MAAYRDALSKITQLKTIRGEKPDAAPDGKSAAEAKAIASDSYEALEKKRQDAETRTIIEGNRDRRANRLLRWKYARWVFRYLVYYSVVVAALVTMDAIGAFSVPYGYTRETSQVLWFSFEFEIDNNTLTTLVGSTAVAAIGLVFAVTNGLFKNNGG